MAWGLANESLACVPMDTVIGSGKDTGSKPGQPIRGFQDTREGRQDLSAGCQSRQAAERTSGCWLVRSPLLPSVRNRALGALRGHRSPGFSPEDTASSTLSLLAQVGPQEDLLSYECHPRKRLRPLVRAREEGRGSHPQLRGCTAC